MKLRSYPLLGGNRSGVFGPMCRGYRCILIALVGWLSLAAAEQHQRPDKQGQHQQAAPPAVAAQEPSAATGQGPTQGCKGTTQPNLSCEAISAQADVDQARDADQQIAAAWWQGGVGALTLLAAVAAAFFAWRAAHHTKRSADAYQAREKAALVPAIMPTPYVITLVAKNLGPTNATIHIANAALFNEPPNPIPFIFPGQGRMSVAVEGSSDYEMGKFDMPLGVAEFYLIGAVIYEDTFGAIELMMASFKIDTVKMRYDPHWGLDWSLWEREVKKLRRNKKR